MGESCADDVVLEDVEDDRRMIVLMEVYCATRVLDLHLLHLDRASENLGI